MGWGVALKGVHNEVGFGAVILFRQQGYSHDTVFLRLSIAQRLEGRRLVIWDYSAGWGMDFRRLKFYEGHFEFFSTSSTVVLEL